MQHIQDFKNKGNTGFSCSFLNTRHNYNKTEDTTTLLKTAKQAQYMKSIKLLYTENNQPKSPNK
jgi:hypothetical protein